MKWNDIPAKLGGVFLPYTALSLGLIAYLNWQLMFISDQRSILQNTILAQDAPIAQTAQLEAKLKKLAVDILQLANTGDPDAKAIVKKYSVSQQTAAPSKP